MLCVMDLPLLNTTCGIYSVSRESKYTAVSLSINNETQCVLLLCLASKFMKYAPSFILGELSLD